MLAVFFKSVGTGEITTKRWEHFAWKSDEFATEIRHLADFCHGARQMQPNWQDPIASGKSRITLTGCV
jgi:hypothetical protein